MASSDSSEARSRLIRKLIRNDLLSMDSAFAEAMEWMDHMKVEINQAKEKLQKLQSSGGSQRQIDELQQAVEKLEVKRPTLLKACYNPTLFKACYNPRYRHRHPWSNVDETGDGMTHFFYQDPKVAHSDDFEGHLKAFDELPEPLRYCLLCFFKFPRVATIKKTTLIYLWIGQGFISWHVQGREEYPPKEREELPREEDAGKKIFDELVDKGFIEPIFQNCSLVPYSCRMSLSVRSALDEAAKASGFTSNDTLDLDLGLICGDLPGHSCLINVGEAIIKLEPKIFDNKKHIQSLYLGRWESSTMHHIELADNKILHGLKNLNRLRFFSLRGISMITELPTSILDLNKLTILDLRACYNLEVIPDNIGLLKSLTHLDMSECYFIEHMPKSLAQLSNLEVLKGFLIGDFNKNKQSCTLSDLSRLLKLRKLDIYICVKDFRRLWDFDDLENFEVLQKLTISWGGCSLQGESRRQSQGKASMAQLSQSPLTLPPKLQKLDLQCFPSEGLIDWLRPAGIKRLKKLYIRGGQLYNLGQSRKPQWEQWNVEILRLKYLSELEIDWGELRILFPKLIYLHQVECPKLTNFPCDESGVWMDRNAIYIQEQLQKYSRTSDIGSSSMVESGPTFDQDDCNIRSIDE